MILLIDNRSGYFTHLRNALAATKVHHRILRHNEPWSNVRGVRLSGLIMSGGPGNPFGKRNLMTNILALMNLDVPVLGICLGQELLTVAYGGTLGKLRAERIKKMPVTITKPNDPLFRGLPKQIRVQQYNWYYTDALPKDFRSIVRSDRVAAEGIRHKRKPIYGVQWHPEQSGEHGQRLIENFVTRICR